MLSRALFRNIAGDCRRLGVQDGLVESPQQWGRFTDHGGSSDVGPVPLGMGAQLQQHRIALLQLPCRGMVGEGIGDQRPFRAGGNLRHLAKDIGNSQGGRLPEHGAMDLGGQIDFSNARLRQPVEGLRSRPHHLVSQLELADLPGGLDRLELVDPVTGILDHREYRRQRRPDPVIGQTLRGHLVGAVVVHLKMSPHPFDTVPGPLMSQATR